MIYIEKNTTNTIVLTLSESVVGPTSNYLFQFKWENSLSEVPELRYFTAPDDSSYTIRYNEFELTEGATGATGNADDSPINLKNGQYKYTVYVTANTIDINNIDLSTYTFVEEGRMVVDGLQPNVDPRYN